MNALPSSPRSGFPPTSERVQANARDLRLRKHADYQRVYRAARKQFSISMSWFAARRAQSAAEFEAGHTIEAETEGPRVGLTVGKVLGKAHDRNRIKRRMREAVRRHIGQLPASVDVVLHPKHSVLTLEFAKLEAEVLRIFRQAAAQFAAGTQVTDKQVAGQVKTQARG